MYSLDDENEFYRVYAHLAQGYNHGGESAALKLLQHLKREVLRHRYGELSDRELIGVFYLALLDLL